MKIKLIVMLLSLTTVVTSGVMIGVKNNSTEDIENIKESKASVVRNVKESEDDKEVLEHEVEIAKDAIKEDDLKNNENNLEVKTENKANKAMKNDSAKTNKSDTKKSSSKTTVEKKQTAQNKVESKVVVDENASTGTEGMRSKYEDAGILTIYMNDYLPIIGGYATSYRYATVDLVRGKMTVVDHTEILDSIWNSFSESEKIEEGPKVQEQRQEYKLSQEEIDYIFDMVMKAENNIYSNDVYSFELYRDNMFNRQVVGAWDYENDGTDNYYFTIDSTYFDETVYVFDNIANIRFLYNLLLK